MAPHRIRRLRCRVTAPSGVDGFALRGDVRRALDGAGLPALASAFDAVLPGDDVVEIGRLEVRVSLAAGSDISLALPGLVAAAVRAQLEAALDRGRGGSPQVERARRSSPARSRREALLVYLRRGVLPSAHAGLPADDALSLLRAAVPDLLPDLPADWRRAGAFPEFLERLLQLMPEANWPAVGRVFDAALPRADRSPAAEAIERLVRSQEHAGRNARLEAAVGLIVTSATRRAPDVAPTAEGAPEGSAPAAGRLSMPAGPIRRRRHERTRLSGTSPPDPEPPASRERAAVVGETGEEAARDDLPVIVPHAGLVLLHPYLPRLFDVTGLARPEKSSLAPESLHRAASLLYWLATGRGEPVEFELGAIKVLLGLAPTTPLVVGDGLLTAAEREEADALVAAAISHWAVLKQTTVASFRAGFLQRTGLLYEEPDGWRLRVQPEAYDVLLGHLPWSIGVVKLPWMSRPLFCEWAAP